MTTTTCRRRYLLALALAAAILTMAATVALAHTLAGSIYGAPCSNLQPDMVCSASPTGYGTAAPLPLD